MPDNSKVNNKKIIDCLDSPVDCFKVSVNNRWHLAELMSDTMNLDYFDDADDCDIFDYEDILSWCVNSLDESPVGRLMLREAIDKDWILTLDDLGGSDYCIDVDLKTLTLDNNALVPSSLGRSVYFRNVTLITLIKALRDIWQEKRHGGFDDTYAPQHVMMMERIRAADLDVIAIMVAWELRTEEHTDIWRHMIGSDVGDMAMTYSSYLERDPTASFSGQALRATFKQWFCGEDRVNACDQDTLDYLDDILMSCGAEAFGKKNPSKMGIEMLSCLPDKTAYLQGQGGEILSDPLYSSIDNDFNESHLLHIIHDTQAIIVQNVPFRDEKLAMRIFPQDEN